MLKSAVPFLACAEIDSAIEFYRTKLGFTLEWTWGDPPGDAGLRRDDVTLFLVRNSDLAARIEGSEVVIFVDDVDALHGEHRAGDAPIVSPIENKPWGIREYTVRDPNGYLLRFSQGIQPEPSAEA